MMKPRTILAKDIKDVLYESYGDEISIFENYIHVSIKAAEASAVGESIYKYSPNSPVALAYMNVTKEGALK